MSCNVVSTRCTGGGQPMLHSFCSSLFCKDLRMQSDNFCSAFCLCAHTHATSHHMSLGSHVR